MIYRRFGVKLKLWSSAEASSSAEYSVILTTEGSASAEGQNFRFGLTLMATHGRYRRQEEPVELVHLHSAGTARRTVPSAWLGLRQRQARAAAEIRFNAIVG